MNQYWLAFFMKTKYNKMWDAKKEDWISLEDWHEV